jgi:hypothetical protein
MKKLILGILIGYFSCMGLRTVHSVLWEHRWYQCIDEHASNPIRCTEAKMGNLNILSKIAGFPMLMFGEWEWFG